MHVITVLWGGIDHVTFPLLLQLLNSLGYPYADLSSVDNTLCLVIALFSAKRNPGFFYTNDLKVRHGAVHQGVAAVSHNWVRLPLCAPRF